MSLKSILLLLIINSPLSLLCQAHQEQNICLNTSWKHFIIGLDNPIDVVYPQAKPIKLIDISADFYDYKSNTKRKVEIFERSGIFYIRPDSIGYITISVNTIDGIKTKTIPTKTIIATSRLSRHGANQEEQIFAGEFKVQLGVLAVVEGYGMDAKCNVIEYEIIRIDINNKATKHHNIGGKFDEIGRRIITEAESGDLYIFRKIYCRCPEDDYKKRLEDMTFEIK